MTALADEILWLLRTGGEALMPEQMINVLNVTGYGTEKVPLPEIEVALDELMTAGLAQRELRRGRCYYSKMPGQSIETTRHVGSG